ncbi:MAG: sorbosone dehydrogenase family protein [Methanomicrobiales archaeon]|nr:sorbosone dehydrogenase family protein [Methanomicrobiales archaeon]
MRSTTPVLLAGALSLAMLVAVVASGCLQIATGDAVRVDAVRLPEGFHIDVYADNVPGARSMTLGSNGTLFIGTRSIGRVYAIPDRDRDNRADSVIVLAEGLHMPNGVAFRNGSLYVAEVSRILRFDGIEDRLESPPDAAVVTTDLPDRESHGWKFLAFGPDGMLYVPVGMPCNVCDPEDERFGTILRMNPDGTGMEIFARGIRNSVGFDWQPDTGVLWFTDNGRDWLGENVPPDELNRAPEAGLHFGFPYCHGRNISDPDFGQSRSCAEFTPPAQELGPHVAALGMRFYTGSMFPEEYRGQIFIAEHGSWNRIVPIGYRISLVRLENGAPVSYEGFAEGWLQNSAAWGRPVDVLVMPDGALLVSDDHAGAVYRIRYGD